MTMMMMMTTTSIVLVEMRTALWQVVLMYMIFADVDESEPNNFVESFGSQKQRAAFFCSWRPRK